MVVQHTTPPTDEDTTHLWSTILKDVSNCGMRKLPQKKGIIVFGENGSGKTTITCRLNRDLPPRKSPGLEYHFIDVKDEVRDDHTKLSVWILDGEVGYTPLLKYALDKSNFADYMAVIVVNMEQPWNIMEQLEKWADILERYIKHLEIPVEEMNEYKESLLHHFREYVEPDFLSINTASPNSTPATTASFCPSTVKANTNPLHPATAALLGLTTTTKLPVIEQNSTETPSEISIGEQKDKNISQIPITDGALVNNLGIPIIVVVTKTDVMDTFEKEHEISEEQFDLIQLHIRKFCLSYGAALFYVSAKEDKNCSLLNNYIQHRIYGFPFTHSAYVMEKDCIFVPTGWDNLKKIHILEENLTKFRSGDEFSTIIPQPEKQSTALKDPETNAIDEQIFLTQLFAKIQRETTTDVGGEGGMAHGSLGYTQGGTGLLDQLNVSGSGATGPGSRPSSGSRRTPVSQLSKAGNTSSNSGKITGNASENVLMTFFNNLLSKNPTSPPVGLNSAPISSEKINLSTKEMDTELNRISSSNVLPDAQKENAPDAQTDVVPKD